MSYQVLARKWRPRTFHDLVGQEHVVRALTNALDQQRLHHAFLFTGTRGVGKTTIARIFAKSLNCETGISSTPCGQCSACREIDTGRFIDLIEVDAASRTKVEDTRDLLENVQYAPSRGRFKVYLIDEVHMLSTHSFNALLKTLEEPPSHVKFLLATTDPQKLPVTILSRCLQFSLKRLPAPLIASYLDKVLIDEQIPHDEAALRLLARAGEGSMRDALSLLDQAIAFGGGRVEQATVSTMLGSIDRGHVVKLLDALASRDAPALLRQVAELDQGAPDYGAVLAELLALLQQVALTQVIPRAVPDDGIADPTELQSLAQQLAPEDVQLFYQIALLGRRDLPLVPDARGGFEMVLLRMLCFRPAEGEAVLTSSSVAVAATGTPASTLAPVTRPPQPMPAPVVPPPPEPSPMPALSPVPAPVPVPMSKSAPAPVASQPASEWSALVETLGLGGLARQLALNCALIARDGNHFHLALEPGHAHLFKSMEERLKTALEQQVGSPVRLSFQVGKVTVMTPALELQQQQAERLQIVTERASHEPHVREMQELFDARITAVHPLDDP